MGRGSRIKRQRKEAKARNEQIIRDFFAGTSNDERALLAACWHFGEGEAPRKSLTGALAVDIARHYVTTLDPKTVHATLDRMTDAGVFDRTREGLDTVYFFTDRGAAFGAMMQRVAEERQEALDRARYAEMQGRADADAQEAALDPRAHEKLIDHFIKLQDTILKNTKPSTPDLLLAGSVVRLAEAGKMREDDPLVVGARKLIDNTLALEKLEAKGGI